MTADLDAIADEVAAARKHSGPQCWVCSIPQREWVERAKKEGRTIPVIVETLRRLGLSDANKNRVTHHLTNHVS